MNATNVDFLFKGSHPAFFWAAAVLRKKGKSVAILLQPEAHSWEILPAEIVSMLGLSDLQTDRDLHPIQILTSKCRLGIFNDLEFTKKDYAFCAGEQPSPELNRGLSFYAKGSDYPVVFGESADELLKATHGMVYFEKNPDLILKKATEALVSLGVKIILDQQPLPIAEQVIELDLKRAKVFRKKFEFTLPLKELPTGASNRMLFVERNSPLIEMVHLDQKLHLKTLLPEESGLISKVLKAIHPYFYDENFKESDATISAEHVSQYEWSEEKSHVDSSKPGLWVVSPAINPELGERSLYVRLSELLSRKFKKQQVFENADLFHS
jgi:hypothetical protein